MHEVDRTRRVAEVIRRELAILIAREINDPRLKSVSVNGVTVSKDLKSATVFFSSLDTLAPQHNSALKDKDSDTAKTDSISVEKVLNNASGYLRKLLSQNAEFRVTPALRFKYDDSIKRGVDMSTLIDSLVTKEQLGQDGS